MRWEPAVHDGLSPGLASLAALRAVRAELGALRNQELAVSLAKLCCVTWRSGGEVLLEEGLVLELEGEGEPARLEDELRLELQDAAELPELLLVALEGPRPVLIGETVTVGAACQTYDTFALAWPGGMANRGGAAAPVSSPPEGATAGPGGALLVPRS
ncbi:unnamed protein product [Prorocentrum cordatum]|uniref:Uncharacterized protein n=1 Tax=Prorocentrum cordatum TaxID=2364126 RepID=A0ABN9U4J8_9DINO|nr:unnamed protein product [Polarella glacialis]